MKKAIAIATILSILMLILIFGIATYAQATWGGTQYEYLYVEYGDQLNRPVPVILEHKRNGDTYDLGLPVWSILNELGAEGWELVSDNPVRGTWIFKRQVMP